MHTLARLLEKINVSEIQECMIELLKDLIRRKKFQNYLIRKHYLIAIDGTQKFYRDYQWDEKCLKRHVGREARIPQFYVYVLEAVLVLDNGLTLPLKGNRAKNPCCSRQVIPRNHNDKNCDVCTRRQVYAYGNPAQVPGGNGEIK